MHLGIFHVAGHHRAIIDQLQYPSLRPFRARVHLLQRRIPVKLNIQACGLLGRTIGANSVTRHDATVPFTE